MHSPSTFGIHSKYIYIALKIFAELFGALNVFTRKIIGVLNAFSKIFGALNTFAK